jgi:hypothetical protein
MINFYLNILYEAFTNPRQSARRIINQRLDDRQLVLLFATSYVVSTCIHQVMLFFLKAEGEQLPALGLYTLLFIPTVITTFFTSAVIWSVGQHFGGKGTFREVISVFIWQSFILALALTPFETWAEKNLPDMSTGQPIDISAIPVSVIVVYLLIFATQIYLLANFIAEVHAFKNIARIISVLLGVSLLLGVLLSVSIAG